MLNTRDVINLDPGAYKIVTGLSDAGYLAYYAGGWVRDYILGHPSSDIDIATNATTGELKKLFEQTVPVGAAFGILLVIIDNKPYEVATFRKDGPYLNGRSPSSFEKTDPIKDAQRRDFTINGIFYDPLKNKVLDYVEGRKDLRLGIIRAIGNPFKRFEEDRLRMIRAVRFSHRFNFKIEKNTKKAIQKFSSKLFPSVSIERIWSEINRMGQLKDFRLALLEMEELGLLKIVLPKLDSYTYEELDKKLSVIDLLPIQTPTYLKLLSIYCDASLSEWEHLAIYFKLSKKEMSYAKELYTFLSTIKNKEKSPYELAKIYAYRNISLYFDFAKAIGINIGRNQAQLNSLSKHIKRLQEKTPLVNSLILKSEGIKPGPTMGMLIEEAERLAINMNLFDPTTVLPLLKESLLWPKEQDF